MPQLGTWNTETGGRLPKKPFFDLLEYKCYEQVVADFHMSTARERIPSAPARTSKSWSAAYDAAWFVLPDIEIIDGTYFRVAPRHLDDRRIWTVGPDYTTNKEFDYLFSIFVTRASPAFRKALGYSVITKQNSPKQGNMEVLLDFGRDKHNNPVRTVIQGRSAVKKESLQGEEVDLAILSEAAEHDESVITKYLGTRCRNLVYPTTPKIKADWLRQKIDLARVNPTLGIEHFRFTPHCNPSYDWNRYWQEHQKAESRVLKGKIVTNPPRKPSHTHSMPPHHDCFDEHSGCKAMKDPDFGEQFGGLWTMHGDRVLPFRWRSTDNERSHVVDEIPFWFPSAKLFISCDWGYRDPAVAGWWALHSDGTALLYREIYETGLNPEAFVNKIIDRTPQREHISYYVGDPQQPLVRDYMRKLGLRMVDRQPHQIRDRKLGYYKLLDHLATDPATGQPKLFVASEKCGTNFGAPSVIHEWKTMHAKPDSREDRWNAIVGPDHGFDMARYFLNSNPYRPLPEGHYDEDEFDVAIERHRQSAYGMGEFAGSWT